MNPETESFSAQDKSVNSDPLTIVTLLYDKAVSSLTAAAKAIRDGEIEARWRNNNRAQEIINHLFMALDLEEGGEIASNLEALYAYMLRRLLDVDVNNDASAAEEVIDLLEPLRASWVDLAKNGIDFRIDQPSVGAFITGVDDMADTRLAPGV